MAAPFAPDPGPGRGGGALVSRAERTARWDRRPAGRGMVRFVFYGRVSTAADGGAFLGAHRHGGGPVVVIRGGGVGWHNPPWGGDGS